MNLRVLFLKDRWPKLLKLVQSTMASLAFVAVIAGLVAVRQGWVAIPFLSHAEEAGSAEHGPAEAAATVVQLSAEKSAAAGLHESVAEVHSLCEIRSVPGSITYNETQHIVVNVPVACIVEKVLVEPGKMISDHQPLAILSSTEVGAARDEVLNNEAAAALAERELNWSEDVARNVEALLGLLEQDPKLAEVEQATTGKTLGDYRDQLVSAYSKLVLAQLTADSSVSLQAAGALSKRLSEQRRSDREVAQAQFKSACENSRFTAVQQRDRDRAAAEHARRQLKVAREQLASLLGPLAEIGSDEASGRLSTFTLLSPMPGRVEELHVANAERMAAGAALFTLADTAQMWVSAEIHERDWPALEFAAHGSVRVRVPALANGEYDARVRFIGGQVSSETRSVPLVAELDNAAGQFKPGMFVWVDVPLTAPRNALTVSPGAIMRHENHTFVFVPEGDGKFRRVDVKTGLETRGGIEILAGLKPGQRVVDRGTFQLKSELLLEDEVE
jgi:cobalt-zinc-cadmium efflux system membrane fusion protein